MPTLSRGYYRGGDWSDARRNSGIGHRNPMTDHKRQFIKNVGSGWLAQGSAALGILREKEK